MAEIDSAAPAAVLERFQSVLGAGSRRSHTLPCRQALRPAVPSSDGQRIRVLANHFELRLNLGLPSHCRCRP